MQAGQHIFSERFQRHLLLPDSVSKAGQRFQSLEYCSQLRNLCCARLMATLEEFVALMQAGQHFYYERFEHDQPVCVYLDCDQYVDHLTPEAVATMERRCAQLPTQLGAGVCSSS